MKITYKKDEILKPSKNQQSDFSVDKIYEIYPEYFVIRVNQFDDNAKDSLDEWIYFLKNEEIKDNFRAKGLDEAKETLDVMKLDEKGRAVYRRREENKMYKDSLLHTAKVERSIEIAKNLIKANMDTKFISDTTGLSINMIEELRE